MSNKSINQTGKEKTEQEAIRERLLFAMVLLNVQPDSEALKSDMAKAWDALKETPIGAVFIKPPKELKMTSKEWEQIRQKPVNQIFKHPNF